MTDQKGIADHLAKPKGFAGWVANTRKAIVAFLASGVLAGFGDSLAHFDFSNLSWGNLWTGLLSGLIGAVLVYIVRNAGFVRVDPSLEKTVEQIIRERFGDYPTSPTIGGGNPQDGGFVG